MRLAHTLTALLLVLAPSPADEARPPRDLLLRVATAGASVSAGFGLHRDTGSPTTFAEVLDATIRGEHGPVLSNAQFLFSIDPDGYGRLMIDELVRADPTLVVAVDFLFWFGYGAIPESERTHRLRRGLALLEELECPVVVGNLPDMTPAVNGIMIHAAQVPTRDLLVELNGTVAEWVAEDEDRLLVDLAEHVERIRAEVDLAVGSGWEGERADELLQRDALHPTLLGASLLAILTAEVLVEGLDELGPEAFDLDVERVAQRVTERVAARPARR